MLINGHYYSETHWRWVKVVGSNCYQRNYRNVLSGKSPEEIKQFWDKRDEDYKKRHEAQDRRGGWRLDCYFWEHQTFPEFQRVEVSRKRAQILIKRFAKHFNTTCPTLTNSLTRSSGAGRYYPSRYSPYIKLGKVPYLGVVCHEYAHHLDNIRHPENKLWHGSTFKWELRNVYAYAKRYLPKEKATPCEVTSPLVSL